jgi:excisionase family DNA binding protein
MIRDQYHVNNLLSSLAPDYEDNEAVTIHKDKRTGTPIEELPFSDKSKPKKPAIVHDPYWSMLHRKNKGNTTPRINIPDPTYMTIREVADLLRVSMLTIKRWGKLGKLDCIRINSRGDRRYLRSEINKLLGGEV